MERLDGGSAVPERLRGAIVALGNFDGFHRGHQAVVGRAVSRGRAEGKPVLVATFDPHPVHFFKPDLPPFRLTSLEQRERLFAAAGADAMLVFRFDATLASVSAHEFVADHVASRIGATGVVTGEDFTFGKSRGGNVDTLKLLGQAHRISVDAVAPVADEGGAISSSRIRAALQEGEPEEAARLLTRPFAIEGVVEHGDKNGRRLGFPTANIALGDYVRPRFGVYAVRARVGGGETLEGVANLGVRPMYAPPRELLEPHFFDFDDDLYGRRLEVDLLSFIRAEDVYESEAALVEQIRRDAQEARKRLAGSGDQRD
jgi:riboflavin kinase/FMN adenylyltransferase